MQMIFDIFIALFIISLASLVSYAAISHAENIDLVVEEAQNNATSILLSVVILFVFILVNMN